MLLAACGLAISGAIAAPSTLPFTTLALRDMSAFRPVDPTWQIPGPVHVDANWGIVGDVVVDRGDVRRMLPTAGDGILLNLPTPEARGQLFTHFEHGDIELEVDVMMPRQSNSGLYFQGRYEIQLLDSWGQAVPRHADIGGIYQRWDLTRGQGNQGYEGHPPRVIAARAPGLWQHFHIKFRAPRFDADGNKTADARFDEVWLNGELLHEGVEVTGPTRSAAFTDEVALAPLMIQGDHGPVAFRNFHYKRYGHERVTLSPLHVTEYESTGVNFPEFENALALRKIEDASLAANLNSVAKSVLVYNGTLRLPVAGTYLFTAQLNGAGARLEINHTTVLDLEDDLFPDTPQSATVDLPRGGVRFRLTYNKHRPFKGGFGLFVEGPGIARHALHVNGSLELPPLLEPIAIDPGTQAVLQRSFVVHDGHKRTHCISVATPEGVNYSYDLASGALLQVWSGDFLDAAQMWFQRGKEQTASPVGITLPLPGDPPLARLQSPQDPWPQTPDAALSMQPLGYELDAAGEPIFLYRLHGRPVSDSLRTAPGERRLTRTLSVDFPQAGFFCRIAAGSDIRKLPDGSFAVDDKRFYVQLPAELAAVAQLRYTRDGMELIVALSPETREISYDLIW